MSATKKQKSVIDKRKILIVDDHPIVRDGLIRLIREEQDLTVCGQAEDAHQALKAISESRPDIAIVDITLKSSDGIDLMKSIRSQYPKLPVLILSMHDEILYAERALRAGAQGYIMKQEASKKLMVAIHEILSGRIYCSDKISRRVMRKFARGKSDIKDSPIDSLSDRELQVFRLIGCGYRTSEIAKKLYLSVKTIETYRTHIKEKLNLANSAELLRYAILWVNSHQGD